jgi:hypothetical protein
MSALGHKQTFAMSALPAKADMCGATSDVFSRPLLHDKWHE